MLYFFLFALFAVSIKLYIAYHLNGKAEKKKCKHFNHPTVSFIII